MRDGITYPCPNFNDAYTRLNWSDQVFSVVINDTNSRVLPISFQAQSHCGTAATPRTGFWSQWSLTIRVKYICYNCAANLPINIKRCRNAIDVHDESHYQLSINIWYTKESISFMSKAIYYACITKSVEHNSSLVALSVFFHLTLTSYVLFTISTLH